eukprot:scaffold11961_cov122-Cylindrotheca_fusiformis.AAC.5
MFRIATTSLFKQRSVSANAIRALATRAPGSNPLEVMQEECYSRNLCDENGYRRPGVHWVFSMAVTPDDPSKPPNLRTVGVQRISGDGIDFVMKKGSGTCDSLASGRPLSLLYMQGRYVPGESAEQWRGEGSCQKQPLSEVLEVLPHYTMVAMIGSKRIELEKGNNVDELREGVSEKRLAMQNKSHTIEVLQRTRMEMENGEITDEEKDNSIRAFRFRPTRLECMAGGPESILWSRWEWTKGDDGNWKEPMELLPH